MMGPTMRRPLSIGQFLARGATVHGGRTAVIDDPATPGGPRPAATYGTLAARVAGLAAYLDELSVGPGQCVAVVAPNSARALELYYAVPATGRILVPVNSRLHTVPLFHVNGWGLPYAAALDDRQVHRGHRLGVHPDLRAHRGR